MSRSQESSLQASQEALDFLLKHPEVETIELLVADLNGVIRGKRIERSLLKKVYKKGFYLPGSVMALDATGTTVEESGLGMDVGDCDRLCFPIPGTLSIVPWHDGDRAQALCTMYETDGTPFFADPRQVLVNAVKRFEALGYTPGIALELEFYLIDPQTNERGQIQPPLIPGTDRRMSSKQVYSVDDLDDYDFFIRDVITTAQAQNIPADTVIAEYAPGQFEVNLNYGNDILAAADQAVLLKRVISSVAKKYGMQASFMAKPYIDESGNGLHIHLSLMDSEGMNVFAADDPTTNHLLKSAVAGLLDMADSTQALLCPNVNSYRRLAPEAFAPTSKTWGVDNRTVAIRIPSGGKESTRIEHRISGADANPYLAVTTLLAGVVEGITQDMSAPEVVTGNAYEQDHSHIADNQRDALRAMTADPRVLDWFGADFIEMYGKCKWSEVQLFERQVTAMEYELLLPYT
ncbi:glutamine synthetase family protein [Litoribrevibacter albus]|uniref:Glutamine synthetase n=1 Tax=Litoribrevibacter albus TaxID=1473156 RepID=A0AA37S7M7_9GAMM|nr:glutamine synthetase family protein [Litoribrevibacter albus]GLQ29539.1 glutamine synthetase [Litoribrevibacter albus]